MTGRRDRLIHAYFGIDYLLIWDVVMNKISVMREQIAEILSTR